jgi:hypothetical protein
MKKLIIINLLIMAAVLIRGNWVFAQAEKPQTYTPATSVYYIKIHKIADHVISIVTSLNSFIVGNLANSNSEAMSLLNFEFRKNPEITIEAYAREKHFGGWVKNKKSGDCFNTRNKVLVRENTGVLKFKQSNKCSVESGKWVDPYSGNVMTDAQAEIQIDHMVPLKEAYISGGHKWTFKERCLYGNYLGYRNHLVAVSGEENNQKSANTPEDYMPPDKTYHCKYLKDWLTIKSIWGLSLMAEEIKAIKHYTEAASCDKSTFTITQKELEAQRKFMQANAELCKVYEIKIKKTP